MSDLVPTTESRVRAVLNREGFADDQPVSSKLMDDLGLDSLDRTEFAMALEDEFPPLEVAPDEEQEWCTILDVVQYVDAHVRPQ
jgi:acyl carrier protein